jgi:hypothetical protein
MFQGLKTGFQKAPAFRKTYRAATVTERTPAVTAHAGLCVEFVPQLLIEFSHFRSQIVISGQIVRSNKFDDIGIILRSLNAPADVRGELG